MIQGTTVTLYERVQTGVDAFNRPIFQDVPDQVEGVLVAPAAAEDIATALQLDGKHLVYELYIPRGDRRAWEDRRVDFFGQSFRIYGPVQEYIDENVPGPWNKRAKVEKFS